MVLARVFPPRPNDSAVLAKVLSIVEKSSPREEEGQISKDSNGHHWFIYKEDKEKDQSQYTRIPAYIPPNNLFGAIHNDNVIALIDPPNENGNVLGFFFYIFFKFFIILLYN